MSRTGSTPGFDDTDDEVPVVDAYVRETDSGTSKCVIYESTENTESDEFDRWIAAEEGWYIDCRDMV